MAHEGTNLKYAELCAQWNQYCYDNEILRMGDLMPNIESGDLKITYPIFFDPFTFETYTLPIFFGGTELDDGVTVKSVKAVGLSYFLDVSEDWLATVGDLWEKQFLKDVEHFSKIFYPDLKVRNISVFSCRFNAKPRSICNKTGRVDNVECES